MLFTVKCPQCQKPLRVDEEKSGKKVRCPSCAVIFTIPPAPAAAAPKSAPAPARKRPSPPPPPEEEDEGPPFENLEGKRPARRRPTREEDFDWRQAQEEREEETTASDPGWKSVISGLGLMRLGAVLWLAAGLVYFLGSLGIMFLFPFPDDAAPLALMVGGLAGLLWIGGAVVAVIGSFLCVSAPEDSGVKTLALLGAIFNIVFLPVGFILSMLFLRGVGKHFNNQKLAAGTITYMIFALATPFVLCLINVAVAFLTLASRGGRDIALGLVIVMALWAGAVLALELWYLGILRDAQHTVSRAVRRAAA